MSEYKPGTVAVVTIDGEDFRAIRTGTPTNMGWEIVRPAYRSWVSDKSEFWRVTDVHPLVVLDLGNDVPSLVNDLRNGLGGERANAIADQIEAQTKPPRIPEPGLWGVVNAACEQDDLLLRKWVRYGTGWRDAFGKHATWDQIIAPVLIREGVES